MISKAFVAIATISSIVAAAPTPNPSVAGAPIPKRSTDTYGNMATWYDAETGNAGACGNYLSNNDRFIAVSNSSPIPCGQWMVRVFFVWCE